MEDIVVDRNEIFDFVKYTLNFKNIKDIEFRNCDFLNVELLKLIEFKEYDRIAFIDCTFEDETLIKKIKTKSLSFTNSKITNYEFVYDMIDLKKLTIVNGNIDANKLNLLPNLEYLRISNSFVTNIEKIILNNLKYLLVDNTNINNLAFVKKLPNLELLSISEEQELNNKELLTTISDHIKIIIDSVIEMDVNLDE